MDIIFLILCTLCAVIISKIMPIIYNQYVIWRKIRHIPKGEGYPIIGASLQLINLSEEDRVTLYLSHLYKFKEGIILKWMGGQPVIHVFKPEFLEIIFPSTVNIEKGLQYKLLWPWLGKGLLTSTGVQWFHDRRLIGPTFHFSILEQFAIVQSEKAEILIKCLEKEIERNPGKAIDIFPFAINVVLDIICETAMGVNVHAQEAQIEYVSSVHRATKLTLERMIRPWYWLDWLYYLTPMGKEYKSLLNILHGFTKKVINRKKRERESTNDNVMSESENDQLDAGKRKRKAFLDVLLDENEKADTPLTDDELRAQVDTFMFEGHDTTAVAITWTLFLLGNNLDHQERVHEELEQVFKDSKMPATAKELSQLKYLDRVIKETLRLYPSVPIITRKLAEDIKLDRYTLAKGTTVMLSIILAHRNPDVWPNPLKFDPDRFLPENSQHRNPYAYVPFSAGPRNCIGQRFAQLEEKIILTAILRKWRVKSVHSPIQVPYSISLISRPNKPILVHFTPKE
ncbi:cytochrome P450 4C1 isoform X1 [Ooceraea biroi]|nr:cytochrome P450 4C1 isoform X1 [Ooceraea biroi]XP_026830792.1 cytochrome P450 4C1 isoform X1 [Ooceraea biroi]XP_026830793.1 cytochrome P450 4C1 isoform X1 [Ooceraea biroi]